MRLLLRRLLNMSLICPHSFTAVPTWSVQIPRCFSQQSTGPYGANYLQKQLPRFFISKICINSMKFRIYCEFYPRVCMTLRNLWHPKNLPNCCWMSSAGSVRCWDFATIPYLTIGIGQILPKSILHWPHLPKRKFNKLFTNFDVILFNISVILCWFYLLLLFA